ncbi:ATP-binding protein [Motiliproteus sp.]|uniref:ATP-binding protein n=1 Tax=Motiliproteus sp. TaxID=1898955 RepID=UPI003BA9A877
MRLTLRKKLLLMLPLLGLLPWLGLRYFNAINQVVDQSQIQAARLVAEAAAANIVNRAETKNWWALSANPVDSGNDLEAAAPDNPNRVDSSTTSPPASHPATIPVYGLRQPLTLDGFFSDWPEHFGLTRLEGLQLRAAQYRQRLYLAIEVEDGSRYYARAGIDFSDPARYDYLDLVLDDGQRFRLMAEGPGLFRARIPKRRYRHRSTPIEAVWWEREGRYQLEVTLPVSLLQSTSELLIQAHDFDGRTGPVRSYPLRLTPLVSELQQLLGNYSQSDQQLMLLNANGQTLAITEGLGPLSLHRLQQFIDSGREASIRGGWAAVQVPVYPQRPDGPRLVVQIASDRMALVQRQSLFDLGWQTLAVLLAVIAGLLWFASRLAIRIKRLGSELKQRFDDQGRLQSVDPFSDAQAGDELGELSRDGQMLLQRLQGYTQFLERMPRTLRHELSNPLNTISTSLELLDTETDPPMDSRQQRLVASARRGVSKLEQTIQSITEAVSLEDALKVESVSAVALSTLLQRYVERCRVDFPDQPFELSVPDSTVWLLANEFRLEQLLDKLIDNARDFNHESAPIQLQLSLEPPGLVLRISNRASPIDEQQSEQLFELFSSERQQVGGSHLGLGLYVVKLIARAQQADVAIFNQQDRVVVQLCWPHEMLNSTIDKVR